MMLLPLRAVAQQSLLIFMAIAIEAAILHWELNLPYKRSIEYATSINLLSVVVGWLAFFTAVPFLPLLNENLPLAVINYVFFDRLPVGMMPLVALSGLMIFLLSFLVKFQGLKLLELLLERTQLAPEPEPEETDPGQRRSFTSRSKRYKSPSRRLFQQDMNQGNAILVANATSYTAIAIVLAVRMLFYGN